MEYLLILNTFRIPRSSLDIQDGIYEKTIAKYQGINSTKTEFSLYHVNLWKSERSKDEKIE